MSRLLMLLSCVAIMVAANLTARAAPASTTPQSLAIPTSAATTAGHPRQTTTTKVVQVGDFILVASDPSLPLMRGMERPEVVLDL